MIVRDPGTGKGMEVSSAGYGKITAVCHYIQHEANLIHEKSYSAVIDLTPTGAADCFFYIKNLDTDNLIATSLKLRSASAESVQVKLGDSGSVGGTHADLTCVSRNAGSGKTADVTCESGVDITGLSGGSVVDELFGATTMQRYIWDSSIIVPKNSMLSLYAVTGAVQLNAILSFYFCDVC